MKKFALRGLVILAIVVALCIFFSGTLRTLTTPKVRFAQARMGKMEQETELTGKVVFPTEVELTLPVPEGLSLTITRVYVSAGDKVKMGDNLLATKVTDGEKTLESLEKELTAAQKDLRTLEQKTGEIRLSRAEIRWREAWEAEAEATNQERTARVNLQVALTQAGLEMKDGLLPEEAGEELQSLFDAWKEKATALAEAETNLKAQERYAIPEDTWNAIQQMEEYNEKIQDLESQITALQVLAKTAEKITAPRAAYVTEVSVEKGATADGDTVVMKLTAEGSEPVIRVDLGELKQEINVGTNMVLQTDSWSNPTVKVINTGLSMDGHPYADLEITQDAIYALGSVSVMMKDDIKVKLITRSQDSTCLVAASAVRGSGDSRYVYVGQTESSTFGGSKMTVQKMTVTVLAENGTTASVAEDLSYQKVLYMEDRALTEGGTVMEYTKDAN